MLAETTLDLRGLGPTCMDICQLLHGEIGRHANSFVLGGVALGTRIIPKRSGTLWKYFEVGFRSILMQTR